MKNRASLIIALGLLNALTPFSIDMYLSSFPNIAQDLGVPVSQMALTVSIYFIGFAIGQIVYGPLFDRYGRKKPLYVGLGLYLLATIGCMTARSFEALLFFRFLSALGGCAAGVGATTMVRDFFPPEESSKIFSLLMLVLSVSPLLAPTVGSLLVTFLSWPFIFGVLGAMCVVDILLLKFVIPHSDKHDPETKLDFKTVAGNYKAVFGNRQFITYVVPGSLAFAGLFVYVAGSPAIFMEGFGLSPRGFGIVFGSMVAGMLLGGQFNLAAVKKLGEKRVFLWMLAGEALIGTIFLAGALTETLNLSTTLALIFSILFCVGAIAPNTAALALAPFTTSVGTAAAMMGFLQLGVGSVVSACVGLLGMKGSLPTALALSCSSVLGLAILLWREYGPGARETVGPNKSAADVGSIGH